MRFRSGAAVLCWKVLFLNKAKKKSFEEKKSKTQTDDGNINHLGLDML